MKQKKMDFETGSKKIFVKRLKTLKIPYLKKKSPNFFRFIKIADIFYQVSTSFWNCSIWSKTDRLVKETIWDSPKGEKPDSGHNFFKLVYSDLFIGLFCIFLTYCWIKIVSGQIPDPTRKSLRVDMELPRGAFAQIFSKLCHIFLNVAFWILRRHCLCLWSCTCAQASKQINLFPLVLSMR